MWTRNGQLYLQSSEDDIVAQCTDMKGVLEHGLDGDNFTAGGALLDIAHFARRMGWAPLVWTPPCPPPGGGGYVGTRFATFRPLSGVYIVATSLWVDLWQSVALPTQAQVTLSVVKGGVVFHVQVNLKHQIPYTYYNPAIPDGLLFDGATDLKLNVTTVADATAEGFQPVVICWLKTRLVS